MLNFTVIAADGVALGAAVSTSKTEVEVIVFIAIMLHKVNYSVLFAFFFKEYWCDMELTYRHLQECFHTNLLFYLIPI